MTDPRFDIMEMGPVNNDDLLASLRRDDLVALIDEDSGGIIAYVLRGHDRGEDSLLEHLNR